MPHPQHDIENPQWRNLGRKSGQPVQPVEPSHDLRVLEKLVE